MDIAQLNFVIFFMSLNKELPREGTTSTEEILKILWESKENGTVVGITALSLGPAAIMTAIEEIIDIKNDKIVVLKEPDLLGIRLSESEILLSEIVHACPLRTKYDDPFHIHLRGFRRIDP